MGKISKLQRKEFFTGWLFVAVPLIGTVVFAILPTLMSFYLSFTFWRGYTPIWEAQWRGFENYIDILTGLYSKEMRGALLNTLILMLQLPITLFISLLLAIALNRKLFGAGAFRVIFYIPCLTTAVVIVVIFQNLFATEGVVNQFLSLFGVAKKTWLNRPGFSSAVIIILSLWKNIGGSMLLFLAGLQSISKEYYEAAKLDGADSVMVFSKITLPLLSPMMFFMIITGIMGGFQAFNEPYLLFPYNNGFGPESSTETIMVFMYYQFSQNSMMGTASAISWVLAVLIFLVTILQFWYNRRKNRDV